LQVTVDHRPRWLAPHPIGIVTVGSPSEVESVFFGDHLIVMAHFREMSSRRQNLVDSTMVALRTHQPESKMSCILTVPSS
jgi:hypothetical protein